MTLGITGHQKLPNGLALKWLKKELKFECGRLKGSTAYSSLAIGADQLFAITVLKMDIDLIAVIPCSSYEETFGELNREVYFDILSRCKNVETLDFIAPSEVAFFSAGKHVVEKSDIVFAIWDGGPAKGLGGTGDAVQYAQSLKKKVIHLNPILMVKSIYN